MNNIQELKQIIADAPDGATHVEISTQIKQAPYFSIADIRTIVEQAEENEALKDRVAELEKYNLDLANESHAKSKRISELRKQTAYLDTCLDIAERHLHDEHFEYYTEEVELLGKNK